MIGEDGGEHWRSLSHAESVWTDCFRCVSEWVISPVGLAVSSRPAGRCWNYTEWTTFSKHARPPWHLTTVPSNYALRNKLPEAGKANKRATVQTLALFSGMDWGNRATACNSSMSFMWFSSCLLCLVLSIICCAGFMVYSQSDIKNAFSFFSGHIDLETPTVTWIIQRFHKIVLHFNNAWTNLGIKVWVD